MSVNTDGNCFIAVNFDRKEQASATSNPKRYAAYPFRPSPTFAQRCPLPMEFGQQTPCSPYKDLLPVSDLRPETCPGHAFQHAFSPCIVQRSGLGFVHARPLAMRMPRPKTLSIEPLSVCLRNPCVVSSFLLCVLS